MPRLIVSGLAGFYGARGNSAGENPQQKKKGVGFASDSLDFLAGPTRLELAPSDVTGRRYNQLNYDPAYLW